MGACGGRKIELLFGIINNAFNMNYIVAVSINLILTLLLSIIYTANHI